MPLPQSVTVCECFARDGLQNQDEFVRTDLKVAIIDACTDAGFQKIEAASFAHPKYLPQFADTEEVLKRIRRRAGVSYIGLIPNERGMDRCLEFCHKGYGVDAVATVVSASEPHNQANVKRTIAESKAEIERIVPRALKEGLRVIGGVVTAFGCPIKGDVPFADVLELTRWYTVLGAQEILFGDTTGVANPVQVEEFFSEMLCRVTGPRLIAHFHNTRGLALANAVAALRAGITFFDSSLGGVGGRPKFTEGNYPVITGFTGNACTEDLVCMFEEMGVKTGIDLDKLMGCAHLAEEILGRGLYGAVIRAGLVKH